MPDRSRSAFLSAVVVCLLVWLSPTGELQGQPPGPRPAPNVTAVAIARCPIKASSRLLGTVAPARTVTIGSSIAGRLKKLHVRRGQAVKAEDTLAEFQTDVVLIELAAAKANLRLFDQELAEMNAGAREEDIAEANAKMQAAKASATRAASQLSRIKRMMRSNAASPDELDVAAADEQSSRQLYNAARIVHDRLIAGTRPEKIAQSKARVDLQAEQVKLLEDQLKKHTLKAPFDGYVISEATEAGSWVASGGPIIDLIELKTVLVEVAASARQVVHLTPGQAIRCECPERPDLLLVGKVDRIVPSADTRARTFPVLVRFDNQIKKDVPVLMAGMLVHVDLPTGPSTDATLVPTDAIVLDKQGKSVFVVTDFQLGKPAKVRRVDVELGAAKNGWIAINAKSLRGDELVVTRGNERLSDGATVQVVVDKTAKLQIPPADES